MMDQKEQALRYEYAELEKKLREPDIFADRTYPKLAKRRSELERVINLFDERHKLQHDQQSAEQLKNSSDFDLQQMAAVELEELVDRLKRNESQLLEALTPQDSNNDRDVIIEIRAAAGGDEASLFAGELYRMYSRWAET